MAITAGTELGRYHILEQLGEGGMATVYKAYDTRLERDVAVKVIRIDQFGKATIKNMLARFDREAKSLAKLQHPNIVGVIDYGEHEGEPYLVMEYLPGGTLKQKLGQPVPWQEAVSLVLPIARALEYAHSEGVIHRDVKPSNVVITRSGETMLTDFGIAKLLDSGDAQTLTGTGVGIGTPEYMAPEQGVGREVDGRADVYSLAIVMFELVTGRKPYTADTPMAVVFKHMTDPLPRPRNLAPGLPDAVEKVIIKALAKSPEDRYPTMKAFVSALESLLRSGSISDAAFIKPKESKSNPPVITRTRTDNATGVEETTDNRIPENPYITQPGKRPKGMLWILGAVLGLLIIASLIWISGGFSSTITPSETVPSKEPSPTLPVPEIVNSTPTSSPGTLLIWADETRAQILRNLAPTVLEKFNIKLVIESKSNLRDDFISVMPAGKGPDILFGLPHDQAGTLAADGLIAPMDLGSKISDFTPASLSACTYAGKLYCMPYVTENIGFFYNTALVQTPPTTWDEVVTIGEALKAEGKVTYIMAVTGTTYDLYSLFTAFGGYIFGKDANGNWDPNDLGIDSAGMITANQWLADNIAKGNLPTDWDWGQNHKLFETGEVPFIMTGPWALNRFRQSGVPYAITDFPDGSAGKGVPFAGTFGIYLNAHGQNLQLAQTFLIEYVATSEFMQNLSSAEMRPSAFLPVLNNLTDRDLLALGKAGENATMMPAIPAMSLVWSPWIEAIVLIRDGEQDAATALTNAGATIRTLIASSR